jgi:hypothetical protein
MSGCQSSPESNSPRQASMEARGSSFQREEITSTYRAMYGGPRGASMDR